MADKYDLANLSIDEIPVDAAAAASGDYYLRYDTSAGKFVKVDATDLSYFVGVSATAAEINRAADLTGRVVALTATDAITETEHEGRILYVTGTAAATYTLPEATGSGGVYTFVIGEVNTNGTVIVAADTSNTSILGKANTVDLDAAAASAYTAASGTDTITLNGTTTGGAVGDKVVLVDVATDVWSVQAELQCPAGSNPATPFSSAA